MEKEEVRSRVREALEHVLGRNEAKAALKSDDLLEEGYIDSFGLVELASHLEEMCQISIPPEKLTRENFRSFASLVTLCVSSLRQKERSGI